MVWPIVLLFAVSITDKTNKIIASRVMLVQKKSRCVCMWQCACVCVGVLVKVDAYDVCDVMSKNELYDAGLVTKGSQNNEEFNWFGVIDILIASLCFLVVLGIWNIKYLKPIISKTNIIFDCNLFIGCIKAFCGLFFKSVGMWNYDYMQPSQPYTDSSRYWHLL